MRTDILERKEEIEQWITEGKTKAQMARELGYKGLSCKDFFLPWKKLFQINVQRIYTNYLSASRAYDKDVFQTTTQKCGYGDIEQ